MPFLIYNLPMIKYAVLEISGKQYKALPKIPFEVDLQGESVDAKILMIADGEKIKIGKPYLEDKIKIKKLDDLKKKKIRVAKYHPKSNYRRVVGFRRKVTKVVLEA